MFLFKRRYKCYMYTTDEDNLISQSFIEDLWYRPGSELHRAGGPWDYRNTNALPLSSEIMHAGRGGGFREVSYFQKTR